MIADLKPYPAYKDSGVPWVGNLPDHWKVVPNRALLRPRKELVGGGSSEFMLLSLTKRGVIPRDMENPEGKFPTSFDTYQAVQPGDLIFCLFDVDETPRAVGRTTLPGMVTGAYTRFVCLDPQAAEYIYLYYLAMDNGKHLKPLYTGLRKVITKSAFLSAKMPLPPPLERSEIVRYLDHADRRIARFILAKQKLIKLLEEQRQTVIHGAVTRGLNPNVRLKPSGVEWLGDVPEHWQVVPAKRFYREIDERSATGSEELLSVSHITGVTPRSQKNITMFMASSYAGHKLCKPADLVINTMWAWMGALGVAKHTGIVSPSYGVYRPLRGSKLSGDYADLLLRTMPYISEYICRSTGIRSSRLRLYPEHFLRINVVCPPPAEQKAIVERVTAQTAATNRAIAKGQREIDLLREYRTRLMNDVVTGKLDVREAMAKLPDEPEDASVDRAEVLEDEESDEEAFEGFQVEASA